MTYLLNYITLAKSFKKVRHRVTMSFSLYMKTPWLHILMTSITAMLIGMMIYIIFLLEHPFSGPLALQATPFVETLKVFDEIDEGY